MNFLPWLSSGFSEYNQKGKAKKRKNLRKKVFFNASVIIAGILSPSGGSGKLLAMVKVGTLNGEISEIIVDEVLQHASKTKKKKDVLEKQIGTIFSNISEAPKEVSVRRYGKIVTDFGDAHVLASCKERGVDYLLTLDRKHLLILRDNIKDFKILTPGEFLEKTFTFNK